MERVVSQGGSGFGVVVVLVLASVRMGMNRTLFLLTGIIAEAL